MLLLLSSPFLLSCSSTPKKVAHTCTAPKYEVYLYTTNRSYLDSLAPVKIVIDDSLRLAKLVPRTMISEDQSVQLLYLCQGAHRIQVQFGRYARDTTLLITQKVSLVTWMNYDTTSFVDPGTGLRVRHLTDQENKLSIYTIARDGDLTNGAMK
jgi:hypothetical protein